MRKLTTEEKKSVNAGASSMMGIATGILTVTGVLNLFMDLFNRYFRGGSKATYFNSPNCGDSFEGCMSAHPEVWKIPEEPSNRITIFSEKNST